MTSLVYTVASNNGATGLDDVYVLNDPTEGFVVSRNNGTDSYSDYMNFAITDTYYYTVDGQEVAFTASDKTPVAITFSSLNNNAIGREGARATNGKMIEINGSTVSVHDDNMGYANGYNSPQDVGVEWDTTTSRVLSLVTLPTVLNSRWSLPNGMDQLIQVVKPIGLPLTLRLFRQLFKCLLVQP